MARTLQAELFSPEGNSSWRGERSVAGVERKEESGPPREAAEASRGQMMAGLEAMVRVWPSDHITC